MNKIKIKKQPRIALYDRELRFAVARKQSPKSRYYANFRMLYADKTEAEKEALRLSVEVGGTFFVIEIQSVSTKREALQNADALDMAVEGFGVEI